jgi:hypothetical protein
MLEYPRFVARIVGRDAQLRAVRHNAREQRECCRCNDPSLVMARLAPGIWKQDEDTIDRGLGQGRKQQPRIVAKQADIAETHLIDLTQQPGNAIDKRLAADKADVGVRLRLPGEMFAGAKANFEPQPVRGFRETGVRRKRRRLESTLTIGDQNFDFRQQRIDQRLAIGPKRPPKPPTVQRTLGRTVQLNANFSWSAISVFSQEKPPSASGLRPKWP